MQFLGLLSATALTLLPVRLLGQDSLPRQLEQLKPAQRVRLVTVDGQRSEGPIRASVTGEAGLRLSAATSLPLSAIDSLWRRHSNTGRGAALGALLFGATTALLSSKLCSSVNEGFGCEDAGIVVVLTVAGAAVGAGVGALIGSGSAHWQLLYARPRESALGPRRDGSRLLLGLRLPFP